MLIRIGCQNKRVLKYLKQQDHTFNPCLTQKKEKKSQQEANTADTADAKEFDLLNQMMNEHKARKRIRGPYRKSYQPPILKRKDRSHP